MGNSQGSIEVKGQGHQQLRGGYQEEGQGHWVDLGEDRGQDLDHLTYLKDQELGHTRDLEEQGQVIDLEDQDLGHVTYLEGLELGHMIDLEGLEVGLMIEDQELGHPMTDIQGQEVNHLIGPAVEGMLGHCHELDLLTGQGDLGHVRDIQGQ